MAGSSSGSQGSRKRPSSSLAPATKKSTASKKTVQKWIRDNDKSLETITVTWLDFETNADGESVSLLKCKVCCKYKERLEPMRNFRLAYIEGSVNVKTSSFKEHAESEMHKHAMRLHKKSLGTVAISSTPIVQSFASCSMDKATLERTKKKFDIAYFIAKEGLAFTKMKALCDLQERHGVDVGTTYRNDHACSSFVEFIALEEKEKLVQALSRSRFYSFQVDSSTDVANVEEELFLVMYLESSAATADGKVQVVNKFFCVQQPTLSTAEGLYQCFEKAMKYMGIEDSWKAKTIGVGCDGTSVNLGKKNGLAALLKREIPWVICFWCLAHRLELSIKDALSGTFFGFIDEFLLQVYYVYERSPKKCRELEEIVSELKGCLDSTEMPKEGGTRPLRASGTRFITHKVAALNRIIDRFGAYISHLLSLIENPKVKSTDKAKLCGYVKKWKNFKVLLGCACFADLLKPASILCKVLQEDELCIVRAIEQIMKTKKNIDKLKGMEFESLPTVRKVLARITEDRKYQGVKVLQYEAGKEYVKSNWVGWAGGIEACLKDRLQTEHIDLLSNAITILATNGWQRQEDARFGCPAIDNLCEHFRAPLENAQIDLSLIEEEWDDMVEYATSYLNLVQDDYKAVWWKLFNCADAKKWNNVLALVELLFCLPMANGQLERIFSSLKFIKSNHRNCLKEETLDRLLRINVEAPVFYQWNPETAIRLWSNDKVRRITQNERRRPRCRTDPHSSASTTMSGEESEAEVFSLDEWLQWVSGDVVEENVSEAEADLQDSESDVVCL